MGFQRVTLACHKLSVWTTSQGSCEKMRAGRTMEGSIWALGACHPGSPKGFPECICCPISREFSSPGGFYWMQLLVFLLFICAPPWAKCKLENYLSTLQMATQQFLLSGTASPSATRPVCSRRKTIRPFCARLQPGSSSNTLWRTGGTCFRASALLRLRWDLITSWQKTIHTSMSCLGTSGSAFCSGFPFLKCYPTD